MVSISFDTLHIPRSIEGGLVIFHLQMPFASRVLFHHVAVQEEEELLDYLNENYEPGVTE